MWRIYDYKGIEKAVVHEVEYEGNHGGTRTLTCSIGSPMPIAWEVTDNIAYRGETYYLRHIPQAKKQARKGMHGEAFVYDNVVFHSAIDELASCDFLDVVKEDNNLHYSALPNFSFYCETIDDIADRLQANLDRLYTGSKKWTIIVNRGPLAKTNIKPQALSFSAEKCSQVLERIYNDLGVTYEHTNRTITFGAMPIVMPYEFKYGKGNGLKSIEQSGADDNALVTRARVYGSTRNMPNRYYNKLYRIAGTTDVFYFKEPPEGVGVLWFPLISETMYVPNLMLPSFRESGKDAYIDATDAIAKYGVREGTKFFDSNNGEDEEIYPTIENMTADRLKELGYTPQLTDADNGNLDELLMVDDVPFSGVMPESGNLPSSEAHFVVYLKDVGFNLNGYLVGTPKISFRSGALAGREFDIVKCEKITLLGISYKLTCKRVEDTSIQLVFPYKDYKPSAGDKIVLLEIDMPEIYIKDAELRLKEEGDKWLGLNSNPILTYNPEIDAVNVLRNPKIAENLKEGNSFIFADDDLGISKTIRISNLKIKDNGFCPEYEITLSDKHTASLAEKVTQSVVDMIGTSNASVGNIKSLIEAYGNNLFLSKKKRDTADQVIRFTLGLEVGDKNATIDASGNLTAKNIKSEWIGTPDFKQNSLNGTGGAIYQLNGATYAEFDYLTARKGATFAELIIQEYRSIGGALVISQANGEIEGIYKWSNGNGYDIYLKEWNDNNQFVTNDLVRCQYWDRTTNQLTSYWARVVIATDAEGVKCLNMFIADLNGAVPQVGDKLVQMGNTTDTSRQGCILLTTENGLPRISVLDGIDEPKIYNTPEKTNYKSIYGSLDGFVDPYKGKEFSGYGMWGENVYLHGDLVVSSTNTTISSELANLNNALTTTKALIDEEIREINNRLDGVVTNWFGDDVPTIDNHPAEQWTTEQEKMNHIGDTYTNTETTGDNAGKSWRWVQENGEYKWILIADSDAIKALELASKAQSTADGKRRVFVNKPTTPYDKGDLWVKQEGEKATLYYSIADKKETDNYSESDWLIGATDDTAIKDLQIGGTNLLNDTNKGVSGWFLGTTLDKASSYFITDCYYNGANGVRFEKMVPDVAQWEIFTFPLKPEKIKRGKTYHFSFDLMADGGLGNIYSLGFALVDRGGINALIPTIVIDNILDDGAWKHYDLEFVANVNGNVNGKQVVYFFNRELSKQWTSFSFANLKLEEGNKATTWSPSPEDVVNSLILLETKTDTGFAKLEDSVSMYANETQKYADRVEEVDARITTEVGKVSVSVEEAKTDVNGVKTNLSRTGIDIESKKITVTADNFSIQNNKGETTTSVDAQGNLAVSSVACRYNDGDEGTTPFVADWNAKGDGIQRWYYPNGNIRAEVGWDNDTESFIRKFDENGILLWKIGNPAEFMYDNEPIWVKIILSERYLGKGDIPKNNTSIAGVTYYKKTNVEGSTNNSVYKNNVGETLEYIDDGWYTAPGMPFMREITSSIQGVSPIIKYVRKAYHYESGKLIETSEVMWDV